ncbi:MAG: lactate utilization protein [Pirellulaceae bacterium]
MNREAFLTRVRQAAERGRAYRVHVEPLPDDVSYVGGGDDLCAHMAREVDEVGGVATLVGSLEEARESLASLLEQYRVRSAFCWRHETLDRLDLDDLLAEREIEKLDHDNLAGLDDAARRRRMLVAPIGITGVDLAIAETGTLVVCARPGQERLASLLPPVHAAVVLESQLTPDLLDAVAWLGERGCENLTSNVALITGPSKTGDIELQLTTGVHGPGKWHVLIVRGA